MKTLLALTVIGLGLVFGAGPAAASSDSNSGSCSATLGNRGYFYAYTYQYVYFDSDGLDDEDHDFDFDGFLEGMENATLVSSDSTHLIYRYGSYDLAVPYVDDAGLFLRDNGFVGSPNNPSASWILLCDY